MFDTEPVKIKIILMGDSGVGKSSLIRRFVENHFLPDEPATIGSDFHAFTIAIAEQLVTFHIWDTAGSERYGGYLTNSFYRHTDGALFLYDITSKKTLSGVEYWLNQAEQSINQSFMKMLIGNKMDLVQPAREVFKSEGSEFARRNGMIFSETSAKTSECVQDAFIELALKILQDEEFRSRRPVKSLDLQPPSESVADQPASCYC